MINAERKLVIPDTNFGLIGTGSVDAFREIQDFVLMLPGFKIVYMTVSLDKLWIQKGRRPEPEFDASEEAAP